MVISPVPSLTQTWATAVLRRPVELLISVAGMMMNGKIYGFSGLRMRQAAGIRVGALRQRKP